MASQAHQDDKNADRPEGNSDHEGQRMEPADEGIVLEAAANVVHQSDDFPSGGGEALPERSGRQSGASVVPTDVGSTGRGSNDAGKTDSEGTPGGGMAGSAGG